MIEYGVAPGIHLVSQANVNCYVVEAEDGITLIDAGLPRMWHEVMEVLKTRQRMPYEVKALVLTHGHFDHLGFALRAQQSLGIPVIIHHEDAELATRPYRYVTERNRLLYPLGHPQSLPLLGRMVGSGALTVKGVHGVQLMTAGSVLEVPGFPVPVHTPGHTDGHCILHFPDRRAVFTGDALVTLDPYTGQTGPQIVAGAATKDTAQAISSLDAIALTEADHLLPGHGAVWSDGAEAAVTAAREVGRH
ncbi:Zn-dependent hydrolase [Nesterenkonia sp. AN1]|uniref:Glyoxylase-like metal-dependent hydrolase (Beta-lactamase superfamily II) n=1 Tax=Nesterenkonia aurantiaca TaxID=1436010 RepID=A0A4R7G0L1_9MICC|nr:MBL fold metallo-hydrolase [Nesterenkonia sp. AN1]EXF24983.1 Zn-dependent hydrolase [Nesterenkonia sp. AN1]TDS84764.1 glyoxylase-like metal-dependent hydrolase (beta-lactamase superfamily II) [Nesterenkonia aurantiaca]